MGIGEKFKNFKLWYIHCLDRIRIKSNIKDYIEKYGKNDIKGILKEMKVI